MAIAVVASQTARSTNSNDVTSVAIDTTGANLIIISVSSFGAPNTPTDSKSNTWTPLTSYGNAGDARVRFWYSVPSSVGSGHTFTESAAGTVPTIAILALSGAHATPFDQENGDKSVGTTTSLATGSVTPSEDNEIVVTALSGYSGVPSGPAGYTIVGSGASTGNAIGFGLGYKIQGAAGAENPTWTWGAGSVCAANVATFKEDAGAPAGTAIQFRRRSTRFFTGR